METDSISFEEYRRRTRHKDKKEPKKKVKEEDKVDEDLILQAICVLGHTWFEVFIDYL